ncbi:unnamed protein product [Closterium sp. Naga37s-1]|nr:unnamed protein product [Closterium sp. Naga37s-1]
MLNVDSPVACGWNAGSGLRAARRPEVQPSVWFVALRACCSLRRVTCLFLLYLLVVILLYEIGGVGHMCPSDLSCEFPTEGMFWDHPIQPHRPPRVEEEAYVAGGHLLVQDTGEGPEKPDSCVELCRNVPECAFWMYDMSTPKGYCKLWASDQNPCEARGWVLLGRAAHFAQRWLVRNQYVVGGYCRTVETLEEKRRKRNAPPPPPPPPEEEEEAKRLAEEDIALQTNECPKLTCNTVTRGYMFDHEGKGHFNFTYTGIGPARPHTCYLLCRRTPGCAFWMYNMRSKRGACKMWTREQNPCEPTDAFDSTTAHYVAKRPTGSFVIGGNCDKLPPMKADPHARQAQMAQQQQLVHQ